MTEEKRKLISWETDSQAVFFFFFFFFFFFEGVFLSSFSFLRTSYSHDSWITALRKDPNVKTWRSPISKAGEQQSVRKNEWTTEWMEKVPGRKLFFFLESVGMSRMLNSEREERRLTFYVISLSLSLSLSLEKEDRLMIVRESV